MFRPSSMNDLRAELSTTRQTSSSRFQREPLHDQQAYERLEKQTGISKTLLDWDRNTSWKRCSKEKGNAGGERRRRRLFYFVFIFIVCCRSFYFTEMFTAKRPQIRRSRRKYRRSRRRTVNWKTKWTRRKRRRIRPPKRRRTNESSAWWAHVVVFKVPFLLVKQNWKAYF